MSEKCCDIQFSVFMFVTTGYNMVTASTNESKKQHKPFISKFTNESRVFSVFFVQKWTRTFFQIFLIRNYSSANSKRFQKI